jgi:hypothetical protein
MAKWTINSWNAKVDRTLTVRRLGRQGILYEYELPYGADPMHYYEEAINVKSIKRSEQYQNGKRPGQYQPIGDKRYFTYYQLQKMSTNDRYNFFLEKYFKKKIEESF